MCSRQQEQVEVIGERLSLAIFGTTEKLSKIQRLYAVASHYIAEQTMDFEDGLPIKHNMFLAKVLNDLDAAIEAKMPKSSSPDYNRHIAMKAHSYLMRFSIAFKINRKYVKKALALLEPIKTTHEGIGPYLHAVSDKASFSEQDIDIQNGIIHLNKGLAAIDEFEKTGKERLSEEEIFGGKPLNARPNWLNDQRYRISNQLWMCHTALEHDDMMEKLIFPALQGVYNFELWKHSVLGVQEFKPAAIFKKLSIHVEYLLKNRYYAQVNHLVSVLMFHLVKNGRTAGSIAELNKVDSAKAMVCLWYAHWGHDILWYTHFSVKPAKFAKPIRSEMIRFDSVVEPGIEIYENQFPVDFIESDKEWKKVIKKGRAWCQRALDYFEKFKETETKFTDEERRATMLMKGFSLMEKEEIF